ncbi:hypothetical protein, partial [Frankia sp. Cr2]|uniref:anti-sigma factor family protein n=1 Tax=Frankia sp. Cr2 TaxID=3073932 RepID=UPI002AD2F514
MTGHLGKQIAPLVDGQLDHDGRDRALAHVACCSSCQREVAQLRHLKARLAGLGDPALPGGVTERLLRMAVPAASRPAGPARRRPAFLAVRVVIRTARRGLFVGVITSVVQPVVQRPVRSAHPPHSAMQTRATATRATATRATAGRVASPARLVDLVGAAGPKGRRGPGPTTRLDPSRPDTAPRAVIASGGRRLAIGPASSWRGRRSRTRRTLVSSVAVIVFAVAGAALGETRAPDTVPQPSGPVAIPAARPNAVS